MAVISPTIIIFFNMVIAFSCAGVTSPHMRPFYGKLHVLFLNLSVSDQKVSRRYRFVGLFTKADLNQCASLYSPIGISSEDNI